jgi:sugar lactone lactonase YvrE
MKSRLFLAALLCGSAVLPVNTMQSSACEPDGKVRFVCGVVSPEDLVAVPRSDWVIASGYIAGGVNFVNTRTYAATRVFPSATPRERLDKQTYSACPGPVDPGEQQKFSAHGLALAPGADRVHTVYVVHHGFRESIEVFEIDTRPTQPTFTWIGCVVAPRTASFNSVTPLPGGGFAATNPNRLNVGAPPPARDPTNTGEVWEWHATEGWKVVPGSESSGPNGIEVSRDGKFFFVNLWNARKVMRLSRGQTPVVKDLIDVAFQPDNIRWQTDGSLLSAGQGGADMQRVIACLMKVCADAASVVARIDPKTFRAQEIIRYPANERFYSSTVALQVGKEIWIGTITGDRIARYPVQ